MGSISERVQAKDADISPHRDADFTAFFQESYAPLVRVLFAVVQDREQARDIAQEAFIQLFARWRRISHYERPDAWLRRVAIRMAMRAVRRERQRPVLERQLEPSNPAGPVDLD